MFFRRRSFRPGAGMFPDYLAHFFFLFFNAGEQFEQDADPIQVMPRPAILRKK